MLTHWNKLLNTDCVVVRVGECVVYPIFRVGYSTLMSVCEHKYTNQEIKKLKNINVMIRDPEERFVSGVNEYSRLNAMPVLQTWRLIKDGKLHDRHFTPQYIWLLHLYKYYKGTITIRPFEYIQQITTAHVNKSHHKTKIPVCENFVDEDRYLARLYNQTMSLPDMVKRYKKNVLS